MSDAPTSFSRRRVVFAWALCLACASAAQAARTPALAEHAAMPSVDGVVPVRAELLLDARQVAPNTEGQLGVRLRLAPGWHIYAPAGFGVAAPTHVQLHSPEARLGEPRFAAPGLFAQFDGQNALGYSNELTVLASYAVRAEGVGAMELRASVSLLACNVLCVPGRFELRRLVPIGRQREAASEAVLAVLRRAEMPFSAAQDAASASPAKPPSLVGNAPAANATRRRQQPAKALLLAPSSTAPTAEAAPSVPEQAAADAVDAALTARSDAPPPTPSALVKPPASGPPPRYAAKATTLLSMLALALLGGLVLNAMPCVLPVLAIKLLGLAAHHGSPAAARAHARAYVIGVIGSMLMLGQAALLVRELGGAVGWGFQMQQPAFLAAVAVALTLFCAASFDVFVWQPPVAAAVAAHERAQGRLRGVSEGVLAVLVATPCSAPFLASAAAFALTQPAVITLSCFAAIGLGLAAPVWAVAAFPGVARFLPRPGPWMAQLKGALGFALLATVLWLLWLFAQSAGADALAGLLVLLWLAAAGAALVGALGARAPGRVPLALALLVVLLAMAGVELIDSPAPRARAHLAQAEPRSATIATSPFAEPLAQPQSAAWSERAVQTALHEQRPVLVEFTADWCVTCKYNERQLQTEAVQQALRRAGVLVLVADWTRQDETILAALNAHGRAGVPMTLLYDPRQSEPTRLSEVLRVPDLLARLAALPAAANSLSP